MADPRKLFAILVASLAASCSEAAQVEVKMAPTYAPGPNAVSIFGVFRDGRMSPESWAPIGATLSKALGSQACPVGFDDDLAQDQPEIFAKIDEEVRAEGITEELLARLAPKAEGDLILTISIHGRAALPTAETEQQPSRSKRPPRAPRPGMARRTRPASSQQGGRGLELLASFYSVRQGRSIARVNVRVVGSNVDEALHKLADEVRAVVPNGSCKGFRWSDPPGPR
jgi:hypothetical protein